MSIGSQISKLADKKGVYGMRLASVTNGEPIDLVVRPDRFMAQRTIPYIQVFQRIAPVSAFIGSTEDQFRLAMHREALVKAGLPENFCDTGRQNKQKYEDYRAKFFGLEKHSYRLFNHLCQEILETSVEPELLRITRRFCFTYRTAIFRAAARSRNFAQVAETFPLIAVLIAGPDLIESGENKEAIISAAKMVEDGVPLKKIAEFLNIPFALRHLKPGAIPPRGCMAFLTDLPARTIVDTLPATTADMRRWVRTLEPIYRSGDEPVYWFLKNFSAFGTQLHEISNNVRDLADFMIASMRGDFDLAGVNPMTLKTSGARALLLSQEWHRRTVTHFSQDIEPGTKFGQPWIPGTEIGAYQIRPITTQRMLEEEGQTMQHCVATYGRKVLNGHAYIFRCLRHGVPTATIELEVDQKGSVRLAQARAKNNTRLSAATLSAIRAWLRDAPEAKVMVPPLSAKLDDHIPF
jgi:hypothetical protein